MVARLSVAQRQCISQVRRQSLTSPFILTVCVLPFGLLTPILEIGPTHVFNPDWPGHARLHEVWQLMTHSTFALLCVWLAWWGRNIRLAALIALIVSGGFLAAYALNPLYDGTMKHSDGSELTLGGINVAVAIMVLATFGQAGVLAAVVRRPSGSEGADASSESWPEVVPPAEGSSSIPLSLRQSK
jgi:hypothetical protein